MIWLFGVVWLFWLRVAAARLFLAVGVFPRDGLSAMERNFYYVGIAFFGMINGMFNQLALLFALIHRADPGAGAAVRQRRR